MKLFKLFKRKQKKTLDQELENMAKEFSDLKFTPKGFPNHSIYQSAMSQQFGSFGVDLGIPKEKRVRSVSKKQVEDFTNRINLKIAALIRLRASTTDIDDITSLTISIDMLEMTREMLIEVFIKIPEDEPDQI